MYRVFSEGGETPLPSKIELTKFIDEGLEPKIFLDSCVCLHIVKVVDYGRQASNVDLKTIVQLKEYLHEHPSISITPFFGLMELCTKNGLFDKAKFEDFKHRIDFFKQISYKRLKNFNYNFQRDYFIFKAMNDVPNIYPVIAHQLNNTYCTLLKIRSLALKNVTKANAEKNVEETLDWMINELDSMRSTEFQLALNVFGGNTSFWKMIGLDSKPADAKKKLMGTTWDIFHSKNISNSQRLYEMLNEKFKPYFLTSDSNLSEILAYTALTLVKDGGKDFITSSILQTKFNYPHLNDSFREKINEKMFRAFVDRRNKQESPEPEKVKNMLKILELENKMNLV